MATLIAASRLVTEEGAMFHRTLLLALACLGAAAAPANADVITDWNEKAVALVTPRLPPPQAHRVTAMTHVAMFDAVNSIERRYRPYLAQLPASSTTSREAAAATAAGVVLIGLHPANAMELKAALEGYLAGIPESAAKTEGMKLGEAVAAKILAARANDGASAADDYRPRTTPGVYVPTPPVLAPMWPKVAPFAMVSPSQFRPEGPPPLASERWAADLNEIKDFGGKTSVKRTARQTEDARFWLITGPQAYDPIVRQLVAASRLSLIESARFMALTSMAAEDALIAVLDAKYHYNFWRPVTAIRNGDLNGNAAIQRDPTWQPIDNTPMHPEYPCAHCIVASAVAGVAEALLGTADVPEFAMSSATAPGITHRWTNLRALSGEISEARVWAGFHYRFSIVTGQDMGRNIARYVVENSLLPAATAGTR
jgi:hypothetical protein